MSVRRIASTVALLLALVTCNDREPLAPSLAEIRISPDSATLAPGDTLQLSTIVLDRNGQPDVSANLTWQSSNPSVATVTAGRVVALAQGLTNISAGNALAADTIKVVVTAPAPIDTIDNVHSGVILDTVIWYARDNPHTITDTLVVNGQVTIEPGVQVLVASGAAILVHGQGPGRGELIAEGVPGREIRFGPRDAAGSWTGIWAGAHLNVGMGGTVSLKHVVVESAQAIVAGYISEIRIEDSTLRNTSFLSGGNFAFQYLRNSVVESGDVAIGIGTVEDNVIRRGRLFIARPQSGTVTLGYNRIEDSPGIAFAVGTRAGVPASVQTTKSLRITGSRGYPVSIPLSLFAKLWPTAASLDSLRGNMNDTLVVGTGAIEPAQVNFGGDFFWRVGCGLPICRSVAFQSLFIGPGAHVELGLPATVSGVLDAVGTAAKSIRLSSAWPPTAVSPTGEIGLTVSGSGASRLSHAVLSDVHVTALDEHRLTIDNIQTDDYVRLAAAGSSITRAEIVGVIGRGLYTNVAAALSLEANGVRADSVVVRRTSGTTGASFTTPPERPLAAILIAASNVRVANCDVTDNEHDGIRVQSGSGVRVNFCNIERNGGFGINNLSGAEVDATSNWWGDPAGVTGPASDGVSGSVDASGARARRIASPSRAVRVEVIADRSTVATSDTVRFRAVAFDSAGNVLFSEPLIWMVSDSSVARIEAGEYGLVVGAHVGTTTVTATSANDPALRASAALTVTPGGPYYRWTREPLPAGTELHEFWGTSASNLYGATDSVVGLNAARDLLRYDGAAWTRVQGVRLGGFALVAGLTPSDVYVQGASGLMHFDGGTWSTVSTMPVNASEMWLAAPNDLFIGGDSRVWRYHNAQWTLLPGDSGMAGGNLWGRSGSDMYLSNYDRLYHWNGTAWRQISDQNRYPLTGTARYVYTMANDGTMRRYDGTQWETLPGVLPSYSVEMHAASDNTVAVIGHAESSSTLSVFDGQRLWPVWVRSRPPLFLRVWTTASEIFISTGDAVLHGRRE